MNYEMQHSGAKCCAAKLRYNQKSCIPCWCVNHSNALEQKPFTWPASCRSTSGRNKNCARNSGKMFQPLGVALEVSVARHVHVHARRWAPPKLSAECVCYWIELHMVHTKYTKHREYVVNNRRRNVWVPRTLRGGSCWLVNLLGRHLKLVQQCCCSHTQN